MEQQSLRLLVRDGPGPPGRRPLPVLLQGCRRLRVLPLLRGRQLFQRPQPPVFSHWNYHSGLPAQMNQLVRPVPAGPAGCAVILATVPAPADNPTLI
jgi:hypothetical protein